MSLLVKLKTFPRRFTWTSPQKGAKKMQSQKRCWISSVSSLQKVQSHCLLEKLVWKGLRNFKDLLSENGNFLSFIEFKNKYNLHVNFLDYCSLVYAIPQSWKRSVRMVVSDVSDKSFQDVTLVRLHKSKRGCVNWFMTFVSKKFLNLQLPK